MALAIWRARQSASAPGEQLDALREVAEAVGGRLRDVFWTVNAGEAIALVEFSDDAGDEAAVLGARVIVQSGEFGSCDTIELLTRDEASSMYEQAEALLEDDDESGAEDDEDD